MKIALCATEPLSRAGLAGIIGAGDDIEVVEEWPASDVLVMVADRLRGDMISCLRRTARAIGKPVVLVISEIDESELLTAIGCGVVAVLPRKTLSEERLRQCLQTVRAGGAVIPPKLVAALINHINRIQNEVLEPHGLDLSGLTSREIEVLRLIAEGKTTQQIAEELNYAERTVKNVLHDAIRRLKLKNRSHAVAYAIRAGLF